MYSIKTEFSFSAKSFMTTPVIVAISDDFTVYFFVFSQPFESVTLTEYSPGLVTINVLEMDPVFHK
ncbi:hypothetical protein D3C80_1088240 [compost metagenome]